jgi:amidase
MRNDQWAAWCMPSIGMPLYTGRTGLPIGTQFAAAHGQEARLLHLAYELEEARPWADRWPEVSAQRLA